MEVLSELTNNVLVITLNRPEAGNALNGALSEGLSNALTGAAENDEVRTIVVTGAGEKIFCAGMDLKAFAAGEDIAKIGMGFAALRNCKKPLIAAVNGHALAGGFEVVGPKVLAMAADCRGRRSHLRVVTQCRHRRPSQGRQNQPVQPHRHHQGG